MDRITLAGHSAPAAVQSGGAIAGVSKSSPVVFSENVQIAQSQVPGSVAVAVADRAGDEDLSAEEIQRRAVEVIRGAVNEAGAAIDQGSRLVIRKDDDTDRFIYEFRDPSTGEVVKQFPAEQVLQALASFRQAMTGKVVDRQA